MPHCHALAADPPPAVRHQQQEELRGDADQDRDQGGEASALQDREANPKAAESGECPGRSQESG